MANALVIVESPAKAKTIEKFLGKGHKVLASYGHVRAIPSKQGMVDVQHGFTPRYEILPESDRHIRALKKAAAESDELILATDLDREGEAIAWHLLQALGIDEDGDRPKVKRVVFNEITKGAIQAAMQSPRRVARDLVDAQQARSVLDYLVGFNLSPFLWKKIRYGLSAGRVQSVALRMICERQREIEAFVPQEYWTIDALLGTTGGAELSARLHALDGKRLDKLALGDEAAAQTVLDGLKGTAFTVAEVARKEKRRNPAAPFTTSTLQQEASRKLGFSARKTMQTAQRLYEGIALGSEGSVGLITYMRTDSVALASVATDEARKVITERYGAAYALPQPRVYKSKNKSAQEAHEAIRPSSIGRTPEGVKAFLKPDEYKLYRLIWQRTVASQMAAAILDATTIDIAAGRCTFRATGQVIRFPGFMQLYIEGTDQGAEDEEEKEGTLPAVVEGDALACRALLPEQHFTQPPPRFTEASLVKTLEEYGIGRPSTYASIIQTLLTRKYVRLEERVFQPEDIGLVVSDLLVAHFRRYVDYGFTAGLEEELDAISRGEKQWQPVLREFWEPFITLLKQKEQEVNKSDVTSEATDRVCPECSKPLLIKLGKRGKFLACSGFPDCRYTEPLASAGDTPAEEPVVSDEKCEKCGAPMLVKSGRFGKYLACSAYPGCKNIQPLVKPKGTDVPCPACGEGELQEKKSRYGKIFYSCNRYPQCKQAFWDRPLPTPCPKCKYPLLVEKITKREGTVRKCPQEGCDYKQVIVPAEAKPATAPKKAAPKKAAAKKKS